MLLYRIGRILHCNTLKQVTEFKVKIFQMTCEFNNFDSVLDIYLLVECLLEDSLLSFSLSDSEETIY